MNAHVRVYPRGDPAVEAAIDAAFPGLPESMTMDEAARRTIAALKAYDAAMGAKLCVKQGHDFDVILRGQGDSLEVHSVFCPRCGAEWPVDAGRLERDAVIGEMRRLAGPARNETVKDWADWLEGDDA